MMYSEAPTQLQRISSEMIRKKEKLPAGNQSEVMQGVFFDVDGTEVPVAIKQLPPKITSELDRQILSSLLQREIAILSNVSSDAQHLQRILGVLDNSEGFVMELIPESKRLKDILSEKMLKPTPEGRIWFEQMLRAMLPAFEELYATGIPLEWQYLNQPQVDFFGDLKPENILVSQDRGDLHVWFVDLAYAGLQPSDSRLEVAPGTLFYLPLSVVHEVNQDSRLDVYQLAVMVYEFFAGAQRHPFCTDTKSTQAFITQLLAQKYTPIPFEKIVQWYPADNPLSARVVHEKINEVVSTALQEAQQKYLTPKAFILTLLEGLNPESDLQTA